MRCVLAASLAAALAVPHPAGAQVEVICPTCTSLAEQLISDAKQAQQYLAQLQQLRAELQSYEQMVTQGLALPMSIWTGVQADIGQVRNLANAASMLTGNSGSILTRLQSAGAYA